MRPLLLKIVFVLWSLTTEAYGLTAITYNVWFDGSTSEPRTPKLLDLVADKKADIIAFQEVESWFIKALEGDDRFKHYHFSVERGWFNSVKGGLLVLTQQKNKRHQYTPLPSEMDRGFLYVETVIDGVPICIVNVHLESLLNDTALRIKQLNVIFKETSNCKDMILLGDFNFGDNDAENKVINSDYLDAWRQLKPNDRGYTWDVEQSNLAKQNAFPLEGSRRLDKVYIKGNSLIPKEIGIIGNHSFTTPSGQRLFPSDHFGLSASFTIKK